MRLFNFILTTFILLSVSLTAIDNYDVEGLVVQSIQVRIENQSMRNSGVESAILEAISTRKGDVYSQLDFDEDIKSLSKAYDKVQPTISLLADGIEIVIKVWVKPIISNIQWNGVEKIKLKKLKKELELSSGDIFNSALFNQKIHDLQAYYVKKGYFDAVVDYSLEYNQDRDAVCITIDIHEGSSGKIGKIDFECFTKEEEKDLLSLIVAKKWNFFTSWISGTGKFDRKMATHDELVIIDYMQCRGYADVQIDVDVCTMDNGKLSITYTVDRGDVYYIDEVSMEGNRLYTDEEIYDVINLSHGDLYSPQAIQQAASRIRSQYGRYGYVESVVDFEIIPSIHNEKHFAVHYKIGEGKKFCVGLIHVSGNILTEARVILNETLLVPGTEFNSDLLKTTEDRLRRIGYFSHVNVYPVDTDRGQDQGAAFKDVNIEVEEQGTGNIATFFGISNDGVFGGLQLTENNFRAKGLLFDKGFKGLRGAGEYAFINVTLASKSNSFGVSWSKPYIFDSEWTAGFDIDISQNRHVSDNFKVRSQSLRLYGSRPLNEYWRQEIHYRIKNSETKVNLTNNEGDPERARLEKDLEEDSRHSGIISAIGVTHAYSDLDNPFNPCKGFRSSIDVEFAGLGGKNAFFKTEYINSYYQPITENTIVKFRLDAKFIHPTFGTSNGEIPLEERYFLGGENGLRGYRSYHIGPLYSDNRTPRGGISSILGSVEAVYKVHNMINPFVFYDIGGVSEHQVKFNRIHHSFGFGSRIFVFGPAGPQISIGYGWPINEDNGRIVSKLFFSLGGRF